MTPRAVADERWSLLDRRDFLRRSLDDAAREHEAGDLEEVDYELLRRRDLDALVQVEAALAALDRPGPEAPEGVGGACDGAGAGDDGAGGGSDGAGAPGSAVPGPEPAPAMGRRSAVTASGGPARRRHRTWLAVGGVAALAAGAVLLVVSLTSTRLPGQVATGSIRTSQEQAVNQSLDQAAVLVNEGKLVEAIQSYQGVLALDPNQRTALAESGWLEWESGSRSGKASLASKGRAALERAVRVAPGFYAARAYLGTVDLDRSDVQGATEQYGRFLADHPPASWVRVYAPEIRTAFAAAGQPVPAGVPTGTAPGTGSHAGSGSSPHAGS